MTIGPGDVATASLFVMMAAIGMELRPRDFLPVLRRPAAFLLGAVGQIVLLPLVAFGVAFSAGLEPHHAVGLVLIAACPGGATSNAFSQLARGDVALSVSLTGASAFLSFLTVPLVLGLAGGAFADESVAVELPFAETARRLFTTTALPLGLGMALLHGREALARRIRRPLLGVATAVVVALILGLGAALSGADAARLLRATGPAVLALIAIMVGVALAAGVALGLSARQRRTVVIELAIQNFNLAMVVALGLLSERIFLGPALVHLPLMLGVAALAVLHGRRRGPRAARP